MNTQEEMIYLLEQQGLTHTEAEMELASYNVKAKNNAYNSLCENNCEVI